MASVARSALRTTPLGTDSSLATQPAPSAGRWQAPSAPPPRLTARRGLAGSLAQGRAAGGLAGRSRGAAGLGGARRSRRGGSLGVAPYGRPASLEAAPACQSPSCPATPCCNSDHGARGRRRGFTSFWEADARVERPRSRSGAHLLLLVPLKSTVMTTRRLVDRAICIFSRPRTASTTISLLKRMQAAPPVARSARLPSHAAFSCRLLCSPMHAGSSRQSTLPHGGLSAQQGQPVCSPEAQRSQ